MEIKYYDAEAKKMIRLAGDIVRSGRRVTGAEDMKLSIQVKHDGAGGWYFRDAARKLHGYWPYRTDAEWYLAEWNYRNA